MDFFGGAGGPSKGPIIGRAPPKKTIISNPIARPTNSTSTASSQQKARPAIPASASYRSSASTISGNKKPFGSPSTAPSHLKPHLSANSSRASTPSGGRRKRTPEPVRSESESESSSSPANVVEKKKKRKRSDDISSTSTPKSGSKKDVGKAERESRELWCLDRVDERSEWGRGWAGFVSCEEAVRGDVNGWAGGRGVMKGNNLDKYVPYFSQEGFGKEEPLPFVEVMYPATGCMEKFILLVPTSPREFNPVVELRTVLQTILKHYIPPSHSHIFGTLSESLDLDPLHLPSRLQSPIPTSSSLATPPPDSSSSPIPSSQRISDTIGDAIRKALAPNRKDGPGLIKAMERYNTAMADLQKSGEMRAYLKEKKGMSDVEWSEMVEIVHEQAYSRVVGPYSDQLEHHPKHPEEVARAITDKEDAYGELRHKFMSQIITDTRLSPSSVFVDLGSGVANCVLQTALQAGCRSLGVELLPVPAHCARLQVAEVKRRWSMWGLNGHLGAEVVEGDFRSGTVGAWVAQADVVLVNNEVFPPSLNADLKNMFLDLKDGAKIISLKPFVNDGFRMNENNCDSFDAIVRLSQKSYHKDWVSWKGDSGTYFVQVIDRSMRKKFDEDGKGGRRRR